MTAVDQAQEVAMPVLRPLRLLIPRRQDFARSLSAQSSTSRKMFFR